MAENKGRLNYIDALKGFAIFCVVAGHIANGYMWDPGSDPAYFYLYNIPYAFHMPLFMLLSGFVFHRAYCSSPGEVKKDRLVRQIINLVILYILWSLILGIFKIIFGAFVNSPVSWLTILMIPIKPIQLYWYLYLLIFYYAIFAFVHKKRIPVPVLLCITLGFAIGSYFIPEFLIFDVKRFFYYTFFFTFGIALTAAEENSMSAKVRKVLRILLFLLVAVAIVFLFLFWDSSRFLCDRFLVNIVIGSGLSFGFYSLFKYVKRIGNNRALCYLGKHCLEIYLLHTFFLTAVRALFQKAGITAAVWNILAGILVGILLPLLFVFLCRKIRIYNVLFAPVRLLPKYRNHG